MKTPITCLAKVIRSKNSSPFELTLDIILKKQKHYEQLKATQQINKNTISNLYQTPEKNTIDIIYFDPAKAIKITMMRHTPSGTSGDSDVYGAQQHAPLLDIVIELPEEDLGTSL